MSDEFEVQWTCIDEAQEDLEMIVAYKAPILDAMPQASILRKILFDAPDLPMNILTIAMYAIISHGPPFDTFPYFQQMIFSGTSLNVNRVLQSHASVMASRPFKRGLLWQKDACNLTADFLLVLSRSAAREILRSYGLDVPEIAVEKGKSLWGRVKWTAMYAERIIEEINKGQLAEVDPTHPE